LIHDINEFETTFPSKKSSSNNLNKPSRNIAKKTNKNDDIAGFEENESEFIILITSASD
jgi:hypothetical protein